VRLWTQCIWLSVGCCRQGNEPFSFIRCREFLDQLSDYSSKFVCVCVFLRYFVKVVTENETRNGIVPYEVLMLVLIECLECLHSSDL